MDYPHLSCESDASRSSAGSLTAFSKAIVSLLACNTLVIVTYLYQRSCCLNEDQDSEWSTISKAPMTGLERPTYPTRMVEASRPQLSALSIPSPTDPSCRSVALTSVSMHWSDFEESPSSDKANASSVAVGSIGGQSSGSASSQSVIRESIVIMPVRVL